MLKEQILGLAMKTLARAYQTKELVVKKIQEDEMLKIYWQGMKETAQKVVEQKLNKHVKDNETAGPARTKRPYHRKATNLKLKKEVAPKKERKSSIRPAHEIKSDNASIILAMLKNDNDNMIKKSDSFNGKKSLAYLIWALGHAERAKIKDGISVHDVAALLYQANKIELYPINISRVVHSNSELIRQVNQSKRTKTYLLTPAGKKTFSEKFLP